MPLDISSVTAKLRRGQEHAQAVKEEVRAYFEGSPYAIGKETNEDSSRYSVIFKCNKDAPFERWTLMIGDSINNFRCCLDHLIFAIGVHQGVSPKVRLSFPICDSPDKFKESERMLTHFSSPVRAAIESVQPYNRTHPELPPILSLLRDLNNTDKHKLMQLAFTAPHVGNLGFARTEGGSPFPDEFNVVVHGGELKDGTEVAAFVFSSPTPGMEYDRITLDVVVALAHKRGPNGGDRDDFAALLSLIDGEVQEVVTIVVAAALS